MVPFANMELYFQIAGWVGTLLIITAYFLTTRQYVVIKGKTDEWMNLFGAVGVGINVFHQHAWPAVALQAMWFIIAIASLVKAPKPSA